MAVKEKSGIIRGLNKGHVSPHYIYYIERPEGATVLQMGEKSNWGFLCYVGIYEGTDGSDGETESHPPRIQTPYLAHEGTSEQEDAVCEGDC